MSYVKAICGSVIHKAFNLTEGQITDVEDKLIKNDWCLKKMESEGLIKTFATYEEAEAFKFKGVQRLAAESLPSLNPPLDSNGNYLPVPKPTYDFANSRPMTKEDNYL